MKVRITAHAILCNQSHGTYNMYIYILFHLCVHLFVGPVIALAVVILSRSFLSLKESLTKK